MFSTDIRIETEISAPIVQQDVSDQLMIAELRLYKQKEKEVGVLMAAKEFSESLCSTLPEDISDFLILLTCMSAFCKSQKANLLKYSTPYASYVMSSSHLWFSLL